MDNYLGVGAVAIRHSFLEHGRMTPSIEADVAAVKRIDGSDVIVRGNTFYVPHAVALIA